MGARVPKATDRLRTDLAAGLATTLRALKAPGLRRVVLAFGAASAIEAASWIAIGVYAYRRGGSPAVGLAGLAILLPCAASAPAAAAFADRHRRRRILLASYLAQALALAAAALALSLHAAPWIVYGSATASSVALTSVRPAQGALLPSISTAPADLAAANVALTSVRNFGLLTGPIVAGLLLQLGGPEAVFAASAVAALMASWLLLRVPSDPPRPEPTISASASFAEGVRLLLNESRAALVVGVTFAKHMVMGGLRAFLVIVALDVLRMGQGGPGILSATLGLGGAIGGGAALLLVGRRRLTPALLLGSMMLGLPIVALGIGPSIAVAVAAMISSGAGRSLIDIAGRTLLGRVSPDHAVARFLGILEGSAYAGLALGSAASALLVTSLGSRGALIVIGGFLPVVVLALARDLTAIDAGPLVSRERLDLIQRSPMFAGLAPASVERLAAQLRTVIVDEGTAVISQGDVGDRFYLLENGHARAEVDGVVVAEYVPGDAFGEIALLRDVPRTATVRATARSTVAALERAGFLAALTDVPAGMIEAERLAERRLRDTARLRRGIVPELSGDPSDPPDRSASDL